MIQWKQTVADSGRHGACRNPWASPWVLSFALLPTFSHCVKSVKLGPRELRPVLPILLPCPTECPEQGRPSILDACPMGSNTRPFPNGMCSGRAKGPFVSQSVGPYPRDSPCHSECASPVAGMSSAFSRGNGGRAGPASSALTRQRTSGTVCCTVLASHASRRLGWR